MALAYHRQVCKELLEEDGLLVMGAGLGQRDVLAKFVKLHCSSKELVFVLNLSPEEQTQLCYELLAEGVARLPTIVTEASGSDRENLYSKGGVIFASSTVLVLDLLRKKVRTHCIKGFLVSHAHRVKDNCPEQFILSIYRKTNKEGFIKAFSESAEKIVGSARQALRTLKALQLRRLYLWPRYREEVKRCLVHEPDVIELHQPLSPAMAAIHVALSDIIAVCLKDLRKTNVMDEQELQLEHVLSGRFRATARRQWMAATRRARVLCDDVLRLASLLEALLHDDCLAFHRRLSHVVANEFDPEQSDWLFLEAGSRLVSLVKRRVERFHSVTSSHSGLGLAVESPTTVEANVAEAKSSVPGTGMMSDDIADEREKENTSKELTVMFQRRAETETETEAEREQEVEREPLGKEAAAGTTRTASVEESRKLVGEEKSETEELSTLEKKSSTVAQSDPKGLEESPKWALLLEVLKEVEEEFLERRNGNSGVETDVGHRIVKRVLILTKDSRTASQLRSLLCSGARQLLRKAFAEHGMEKMATPRPPSSSFGSAMSGRGRGRAGTKGKGRGKKRGWGQGGRKPSNAASPSSVRPKLSRFATPHVPFDGIEVDESDILPALPLRESHVLVQSLAGCPHLRRLLDDSHPSAVILYNPSVAALRHLEVHQAENPRTPLRVYLLFYSDSAEEHGYVGRVTAENAAFSILVQEKGAMTLPSAGYESDSDNEEMAEAELEQSVPDDARGGGRVRVQRSSPPVVIVDTREFRSPLAATLYSRGFEILPAMLKAGDYLLTPTLCVERKSVSDLIQSLQSGRLCSQARAMCKVWRNPLLLIEFAGTKFGLSDGRPIAEEMSKGRVRSQLVILLLNFPALRVVWSRTTQTTAKIFKSLKEGSPEPDLEQQEEDMASVLGSTPQDFLRRLPGVNSSNMPKILANCHSLHHLSQMSLKELQTIMGAAQGRQLHAFLCKPYVPPP